MKKFLKNRKGVIALITMLILMGVGVLGIGMVINSQLSATSSNNYRYKIQTYNAADGMMTLLAQDVLDFNESKYLLQRPHCDIGSLSPSGSGDYDYSIDAFSVRYDTIKAGGPYSLGTTDNFHYSYCQVSGDIEIITQIGGFGGATYQHNMNNVPCIMIRQDLSPGSKSIQSAFFDLTPNDSVFMISRTTAGGMCAKKSGGTKTGGGYVWLKLKKAGNTFTAYFATLGAPTTWTLIGTETLTLSNPYYAGFAVSSGTADQFIVVFSNTAGISSSMRSDSAIVGSIPIKYTLSQLGANLFSMSTNAYLLKGSSATHNYETHLTQTLSRETFGTWHETAQDSAYIPIVVYDFRADKSNPEFQFGIGSGVSRAVGMGMVQDTLDKDRKPVFKANKYHNDSLKKWFRPSGAGSEALFDPSEMRWTGLKSRPKWKAASGWTDTTENEWVGQNYDSANKYANIVIYDSLKFFEKKSDSSFYFGDSIQPRWLIGFTNWPSFSYFDYVRPANTQSIFSPLRNWNYSTNNPPVRTSVYPALPVEYGRGFGFDVDSLFIKCATNNKAKLDSLNWWSINSGYAMEIHRLFTYKPGQTFTFMGNDDVWVYINNHLVMDIGGVHYKMSDTVNLDLLGLTSGNQYWFDFFYCERNGIGSEIYVTTNMLLFIPPQPLKRSWKRDYGNLD